MKFKSTDPFQRLVVAGTVIILSIECRFVFSEERHNVCKLRQL
jgi:hypothetical protein